VPSSPGKPRGVRRSEDGEELKAILQGFLGGRPWSAGLALGRLGRDWKQVVGERLAEECTPVSLEGGILLVRASSGAWAAQVGFLARDLRRRANEVLGKEEVRDVRAVVDPGGRAG
jgi:predicted nucleic acid-binding Zn ribbon protein